MSSASTRSADGYVRTLLAFGVAVGFAALAVAAWYARASPPAGYELSIYAGTPRAVWIAVGVGGGLALVAVLAGPTPGVRRGGLALGASTIVLVALLPVLRNYRYRGGGDSITHLGWARDMVSGALEPASVFYPAVHVIGLQFRAVGLTLERALMLTVVVFVVAFLVFVPLVARAWTRDAWIVTLAAVSAWFLLPLNHVGTFFMVYPTTQALFFLPALLFVFVLFLRRRTDDDDPVVSVVPRLMSRSPLAVLLALFGVALLLVHPQQAANVIVLLATGAVLQAAVRRRWPDSPIAGHRPLYFQTTLLAVAFGAWTIRRERFREALNATATGLFTPGLGSVDEVAQRSVSLTEMGIGIETLFVRLFLVAAVYSLLTGGLLFALVRGRTGVDRRTRTIVGYFAVALAPLAVLFGLYFVNTPTLGFRQIGLLMVFCTLFGAIALGTLSARLRTVLPGRAVRSMLGVVLAGALVVSLFTMFASPIVYKPSEHVSDQQWEGHADAIEYRGEDMYYSRLTLGAEMNRYGDGILGVESSSDVDYTGDRSPTVPPSQFNAGRIPRAYEQPRYVKISRADYAREVRLYNEFRHTREGFRRLPRQDGLNRVLSNGMFRLYVVGGS